MHKINVTEPDNEEWRAWKVRCGRAKTRVVRKVSRSQQFNISEIYKEQKPFFLDINGPFHGRCAYCEQSILSDQYGDIEHYRPKKGVDNEDWTPVVRNIGGDLQKHPGYYWLAYDWRNLLVSCELCNRPAPGRAYGKHNRFPVAGQQAWEPGQEAQEAPILLNPCQEDPAEHIRFDAVTGRLEPKSDRGHKTISMLGLNERHLPEKRLRMYKDVSIKFGSILFKDEPDCQEQLVGILKDVYANFPLVVKQAFHDQKQKYIERLEALPNE
jgi:uncharacterized protein (TIGR02646 family)